MGLANLAGLQTFPARFGDGGIDPATGFLLLIPLSILVVAPAEELLFRGVVQTHLRGATSGRGAVLGAGVIFGLVHVPNYLALPSYAAMAAMTTLITLVGIGFGYAYERTGSLPVAIGLHAGYNSLVMGGMYVLVKTGVVTL